MRIEGRRLVLEKKPCVMCRGTGVKQDGKQCGYCDGAGQVDEDRYSFIPKDLWRSLNFRVVRRERSMSWNEQYVGMGYCYTCVDYGRAWEKADEEIVEMIKEEGSLIQASTVTDEEGNVLDIVIEVTPQGYAVYGARETKRV